jgi:hypothetical protein
MQLLRPLVARCKCDRCKREKKCVYVPEMEEWMCDGCLDLVCLMLAESSI